MEDENRLELSLSLAWCQSSPKPKDIADNSLDTRTEESDRSSKLINDFKHFLDGGTGKLESSMASRRSDKPDEREMWISNDNNPPETPEAKGPESSNKRSFFFEDISNQMKRERESHNSHISINTDDGSTAENDDVADSEAVGSTTRILSYHDNNNGKKYKRCVGPSEVGDDVYTVFDTSAVDVSGQRGFTITTEKEHRAGNVPYSVTFPSQSVNILNMPHSISLKEHGNSSDLVSHHQQLHPSYARRFPPTTDKLNDGSSKVSQAANSSEFPLYSGKIMKNTEIECTRDSGSKDESDKLPSDLSAITPGIGSDLKFGGCGSYPNLPWVSTKGPNGRTISGVTYRFSPTQIKIVCACHGSHMSPEEFVRHASEEKTGPDSGSGFASLPNNNNPTASSQS